MKLWIKIFSLLFVLLFSVSFANGQTAISEQTELDAAPAENDIFPIFDTDAAAGRRITVLNVMGALESALTSYEIHMDNLDANVTRDDIAETITANWVNTANPWADNEVADAQTITAQAGSTWDIADSVTIGSVYSGTTSLDESTAPNDSGAYVIGIFDQFGTSTATNIQDVMYDIDQVVIGNVGGVGDCTDGACLDGSSDGGSYVRIYDGDSHYGELQIPDLSGNITITFPSATSTLLATDGVGTSLTALDGENIQDNTIDDDSIDFADVTLADLTFDVGSVDTTEFGYLNGVTSAIQTQINSKQATVTEGSLTDNVIVEADILVSNTASDEDVLTYNLATGGFTANSIDEIVVYMSQGVLPNNSVLIGDINSSNISGADSTLVSGTSGTSGHCAQWNADGDLVTTGAACGTASGTVDTTGTINADEITVFSDSDTVKALTEAEFKTAYNMEAGVDYETYDANIAKTDATETITVQWDFSVNAPTVPGEVYDATNWNGDDGVATKDSIRDKIESIGLTTTIEEGDSSVIVSDSGSDGTVTLSLDTETLTIVDGGSNQLDVDTTTGIDTIDFNMELVVSSLVVDSVEAPTMPWADRSGGNGQLDGDSDTTGDGKLCIDLDLNGLPNIEFACFDATDTTSGEINFNKDLDMEDNNISDVGTITANILDGGIQISINPGSPVNISETVCYKHFWNAGAYTYNLPANPLCGGVAGTGKVLCFGGRGASDITIDPDGTDYINHGGSLGAGVSISNSSSAANDMICLYGTDTDEWLSGMHVGTWN